MNREPRVIIYSKDPKGFGEKFQEVVKQAISKERVEVYHSIASLSWRLHQPIYDSPVVVLFVFNKNDLTDIVSLRDLLIDSRVLLVLPGEEDEMVTMGHSLRPRFVGFRDAGLQDVSAVLHKMVQSRIPQTL
jgi:hypothetical protein